jgi:hypothetical protein
MRPRPLKLGQSFDHRWANVNQPNEIFTPKVVGGTKRRFFRSSDFGARHNAQNLDPLHLAEHCVIYGQRVFPNCRGGIVLRLSSITRPKLIALVPTPWF